MTPPTRTITLNPPIERFSVRVDLDVHWNGEMLLTVDHFDDAISDASCYKVAVNGDTTFIGSSEPLGKDDSGSGKIDQKTGDVYLAVSEALPGGGGATSGVRRIYIWSGFFPPQPATTVTAIDQTARNTANQALSLAQTLSLKFAQLLTALKQVCNIT